MRDDLARILYEPTLGEVEYVFGDSIRSIDQDRAGVDVTFEHGRSRRFGLVIGADGQHSNVRRLVFGPESRFTRHLGAYLCIFSVPNHLDLRYQMLAWAVPGKVVLVYSARHNTEARAMFAFRSGPLRYDFRDAAQQQRLVRQAFAGESWEAPRLLAEMDRAPDFYFDATSQIRMDSWSRGRVTLVGDAGYGPAPAVGGGTALAVVGAYVLAGELAAAGGDHEAAFRSYERVMREMVVRSRAIAPSVIKTFIPATRYQIWRRDLLTRGFLKLPVSLQRLSGALGTTARALNAISLKDYKSSSYAA
jgi:2-polyprenyl-6-methoxyphenol hydroxylase-like FAD-dependent oxidoreductase